MTSTENDHPPSIADSGGGKTGLVFCWLSVSLCCLAIAPNVAAVAWAFFQESTLLLLLLIHLPFHLLANVPSIVWAVNYRRNWRVALSAFLYYFLTVVVVSFAYVMIFKVLFHQHELDKLPRGARRIGDIGIVNFLLLLILLFAIPFLQLGFMLCFGFVGLGFHAYFKRQDDEKRRLLR